MDVRVAVLLLLGAYSAAAAETNQCLPLKTYVDCIWKTYTDNKEKENPGSIICKNSAIAECTKKVEWEKFKDCVDKTQILQVPKNVDMAKAVAEFLCKDNGKAISDFKTNKESECWTAQTKALEACNANSVVYTLHTKKDCEAKRTAMNCTLTTMKEKCSTAEPVVSQVFDIMKKNSPCDGTMLAAHSLLVLLFLLATRLLH